MKRKNFRVRGKEPSRPAAKIPPQGKVRVTEAIQRLIDLYTAWDKPDQAAEWRKKLDAAKP